MKKIYLLLLIILTLSACSKINTRSKKLVKGQLWILNTLSIDGVAHKMGALRILEDDFETKVPRVSWDWDDYSSEIEWQFQDKGKTFVWNYVLECEQCQQDDIDTLDYLSFALNGKYLVSEAKRKSMQFVSSEIVGFQDKEVKMVWTRWDK